MTDAFEYISKTRLEYRNGQRHAFLGEVPEPVVYGMQGALKQYYGVKAEAQVGNPASHVLRGVDGLAALKLAVQRQDAEPDLRRVVDVAESRPGVAQKEPRARFVVTEHF